MAASAERLNGPEWHEVGAEQLLHAAGKFVADNTEEARHAGRQLLATIRGAFDAQLLAPCLQPEVRELGWTVVYCDSALGQLKHVVHTVNF